MRATPSRVHRRADVVTRAAQACDAAGALEASRELEVLAQFEIGETAEPIEDAAPHENSLIAGAGAADSRAEADHRADDAIGETARVELNVEASANDGGIRQCRRDISGEGRRHDRIRMHEGQRVAVRGARACVHLTRAPARRDDERVAQRSRDRNARVCAAAVNHDDLRVGRAAAKRVERARDRGRFVEHRHDDRKFVHCRKINRPADSPAAANLVWTSRP